MSRRSRPQYRSGLGWTSGVAFPDTLTRPVRLAQGFACVRCCGSPRASSPHGLAAPASLSYDRDTACSCLRLAVAAIWPRRGLPPPTQCPSQAHLRFGLRPPLRAPERRCYTSPGDTTISRSRPRLRIRRWRSSANAWRTAQRSSIAHSIATQAIQEGFILDVLKSYTPIDSYYRLVKKIESDPEFDTKRAKRGYSPRR
jgi:hypothetical protein